MLQRHRIPKARYRVKNWPEYNRGFIRCGEMRFSIDEGALERWIAPRRATPGDQGRFSNLAIKATLTLDAAVGRRLRRADGFVRSILKLLGVGLPAPDSVHPLPPLAYHEH